MLELNFNFSVLRRRRQGLRFGLSGAAGLKSAGVCGFCRTRGGAEYGSGKEVLLKWRHVGANLFIRS